MAMNNAITVSAMANVIEAALILDIAWVSKHFPEEDSSLLS